MGYEDAKLRVSSTVTGSYTEIEPDATLETRAGSPGTVVRLCAVHWVGSAGQDLKIRDAYGDVVYHSIGDAVDAIDPLASPLPVRLPLSYLTDEAGKEIIVYAEFVS